MMLKSGQRIFHFSFLLTSNTSKELFYWLRGEHIRSCSLGFHRSDVKLIFDEPLQVSKRGNKLSTRKIRCKKVNKERTLQLVVCWFLGLYRYASQVLVVWQRKFFQSLYYKRGPAISCHSFVILAFCQNREKYR